MWKEHSFAEVIECAIVSDYNILVKAKARQILQKISIHWPQLLYYWNLVNVSDFSQWFLDQLSLILIESYITFVIVNSNAWHHNDFPILQEWERGR